MEDEGAPVGSEVQIIVTDNWGHGCTGTSSIPSCHICSLTAIGIISMTIGLVESSNGIFSFIR